MPHAPAPATSSPNEPLFDAILRPHRSLTPLGFALVMLAVAAISFTAGIAFLLKGAWPVFGFFGLDVALVYWAFRANFRSGRLYETVRLTRDLLVVRRVEPGGESRTWTFQPSWLSLTLADPEEHHCRLVLASRGRSVTIGSFLAPGERCELAAALGDALARARRPAGA